MSSTVASGPADGAALSACSRWGRIGGPDTDDPNCGCGMCRARRWDRLSDAAKKRQPGLRP